MGVEYFCPHHFHDNPRRIGRLCHQTVGQTIGAPPRRAVAAGAEVLRRQRADAVRAQRAVVREPPIVRDARRRHAWVRRGPRRRDQATHARRVLALAVPIRVRGVTHELTLALNVRVR